MPEYAPNIPTFKPITIALFVEDTLVLAINQEQTYILFGKKITVQITFSVSGSSLMFLNSMSIYYHCGFTS